MPLHNPCASANRSLTNLWGLLRLICIYMNAFTASCRKWIKARQSKRSSSIARNQLSSTARCLVTSSECSLAGSHTQRSSFCYLGAPPRPQHSYPLNPMLLPLGLLGCLPPPLALPLALARIVLSISPLAISQAAYTRWACATQIVTVRLCWNPTSTNFSGSRDPRSLPTPLSPVLEISAFSTPLPHIARRALRCPRPALIRRTWRPCPRPSLGLPLLPRLALRAIAS